MLAYRDSKKMHQVEIRDALGPTQPRKWPCKVVVLFVVFCKCSSWGRFRSNTRPHCKVNLQTLGTQTANNQYNTHPLAWVWMRCCCRRNHWTYCVRNSEVTGVKNGTSTSKRGETNLDSSHFLFCWSHIAKGVL